MKIDPEVRRQVLAEEERAGRIVILNCKNHGGAEWQLGQSYRLLRGVLHGQCPARVVPLALLFFLKVAERQVGAHGPVRRLPRGRFRPQREGLTDAARQLIAGFLAERRRFRFIRFDPDAAGRLAGATGLLQDYFSAVRCGYERAGNWLWPEEMRLYETLSGVWKYVKPIFAGSRALQRRHATFYNYMTRRWAKGAATRKARAAAPAAQDASTLDNLSDFFVAWPSA